MAVSLALAAPEKIFEKMKKRGLTYVDVCDTLKPSKGRGGQLHHPKGGEANANYHYVTYLRIHCNGEDKKAEPPLCQVTVQGF